MYIIYIRIYNIHIPVYMYIYGVVYRFIFPLPLLFTILTVGAREGWDMSVAIAN